MPSDLSLLILGCGCFYMTSDFPPQAEEPDTTLFFLSTRHHIKNSKEPGVMVHTCEPSYLGA